MEIPQNLSLILTVLALLIAVYCVWQIRSLNKLRALFFSSSKGVDLESVIQALETAYRENRSHLDFLENSLSQLKQDFGFAVQKVGLIRFNPFNDGGGNFSFSLALLDAHNTGVILTSMYGREQNRIYSKKVVQGKSDNPLTEEEAKAMEMADSQTLAASAKTHNK